MFPTLHICSAFNPCSIYLPQTALWIFYSWICMHRIIFTMAVSHNTINLHWPVLAHVWWKDTKGKYKCWSWMASAWPSTLLTLPNKPAWCWQWCIPSTKVQAPINGSFTAGSICQDFALWEPLAWGLLLSAVPLDGKIVTGFASMGLNILPGMLSKACSQKL